MCVLQLLHRAQQHGKRMWDIIVLKKLRMSHTRYVAMVPKDLSQHAHNQSMQLEQSCERNVGGKKAVHQGWIDAWLPQVHFGLEGQS